MKRKQIWIDQDFDMAIEEFRKRISKQLGCQLSRANTMEIIGKSLLKTGLMENGIKIKVKDVTKDKENGKFKARFDIEL